MPQADTEVRANRAAVLQAAELWAGKGYRQGRTGQASGSVNKAENLESTAEVSLSGA